jgi:hypothetical protein
MLYMCWFALNLDQDCNDPFPGVKMLRILRASACLGNNWIGHKYNLSFG